MTESKTIKNIMNTVIPPIVADMIIPHSCSHHPSGMLVDLVT